MISSALHRRTFAVMTKSASQSMLQIKQRKRSVCSVAHRRGYKCVCVCMFIPILSSIPIFGRPSRRAVYTHAALSKGPYYLYYASRHIEFPLHLYVSAISHGAQSSSSHNETPLWLAFSFDYQMPQQVLSI